MAKNKGGRPKKFDDRKRLTKVLAELRQGASRDGAAALAGLGYNTLMKAIQLDSAYAEQVEIAEKVGKGDCEKRVWLAKPEWLLSRKYWREYAQRSPDTYTASQVMQLFAGLSRDLCECVAYEFRSAITATIMRHLEMLTITSHADEPNESQTITGETEPRT